ncbi:MAG: Gfo/Idh/MocA family oxidoreductase, partial [Verrucomicrobiota bacterium]
MNRRETLQSLFAASVAGAASPLVAAEGDPMRVAVMGHTGRGNYGHGLDTVWLDYPGVEVVGVSDLVPEGLTKALKRLSIPSAAGFSDYRKMLEATSPDLVAVAPRYVEEHAAMAVAAAEAGAKGIYIEKPFCRDLAEADQIIKACQENGTRLAIAHRNRFHPVLPVVSELIDEGAIGKLLEIRARGKEDARGGCQDLWVLGSHLLNLIHYFAGDPIACSATIYANGKPATATDIIEGPEGVGPIAGNEIRARYEMSSGVPVYFDSLQNAGSKEAGFGFQFIGTNGLIDLRADREPLVHLL